LTLTRQRYRAEVGVLDFADQADAARQQINAWVKKQTADKIKDLIPPGGLNAETRLVLTNAIYFKGDWASQFQTLRTRDEDFAVSATQKVKVPLMEIRGLSYRYAEDASHIAARHRLGALFVPHV
jgi:serpin B